MFGKLFKYVQGRSTGFAIFFALTAFFLAWFHRLGMEYAAVITAIQGFVVVRALGDDYHERNKQ